MKDVYAWIPWFDEICRNIAEGGEEELARRAREVRWKDDGSEVPLLRYGDPNIDPFSFLYTLATGCKHAGGRRRLCASVGRVFELATEMPVEVEEAFIFPMGVPMNPLFHDQGRGDPALLWRLFRSARDGVDAVSAADFDAALAIGQVRLPKLTQTLFLINPLERSRHLWIVHEERRYDMKAVWAAAQVEPGTSLPVPMPKPNNSRHIVKPQLEKLGFTVENSRIDPPPPAVAPRNQILYGPPGTGKTWQTVNVALSIVEGGSGEHDLERFEELRFDSGTGEGNIALVTFHQNFAYEDFVEGIRPVLDTGELRYELREGLFKHIARVARERPSERFVLIIDEINRGNIARIFGELITLIEDSRRIGETEETFATLPYSSETFGVPGNLYLVGTMNTADRSIQLLDTALRRRFTFREMMPDPNHEGIGEIGGVDCRRLLRTMNERIAVLLDREHQMGHTYFLNIHGLEDLAEVFQNRILPLLQEYFFDDWSKIRAVLGNNAFVSERSADRSFPTPDLMDEDRKIYERLQVDDERWRSPDEYQAIYRRAKQSETDEGE